ncbi:MAG TPA: 6,7-dimethyl-8-ribityllumazine synthase [Firmicutes bacterium]|nr:6,7-dimethyl-8-ribityllumazine synthase [Bacillota bacterium]
MQKVYQGILDGRKKRFAIVVSRFNEAISQRLLEGALDCLRRHNTDDRNIEIVWVPGSFEIPMGARQVAFTSRYDAVICLGAVIRGATPHFDYIAAEVARGIARVAAEASLPVIFGVITADSLEQAIERSGGKSGNKGWDAAMSAIEMADLFSKLKATRK